MPPIRTVLCPVDFSDLSRRELALAVEVCEAFSARLVLHYNLDAPPPGLSRVWEWNELHLDGHISEPEAERRLRGLMAELPKRLATEARMSRGSTAAVLLEMAKLLPADLIVLGSHGRSTEDHVSLTERMIDACSCPVLTVDEGAHVESFQLCAPSDAPRTAVVVPTDLSAAAGKVFDYALDLARVAPLDLHLLHVVPALSGGTAVDRARRQLDALARTDASGRTTCHVERGEPVGTILRFGDEIGAGFVVMGEHTRLLMHLFAPDVARAVLHRAARPVWFVPPAR